MASKLDGIKRLIDEADPEKLQDAVLEVIDFNEKGHLLRYAIERQDIVCVKVLVDAGCDPSLNIDGVNGFTTAVLINNIDILELLLEDYMWLIDLKKDSLKEEDNEDNDSFTDVMVVTKKDNEVISKKPKRQELQRLKCRIDICLQGCVFVAADHGSSKCLKKLLELGVDPNICQYHENEMLSYCSPLIAACASPVNKHSLRDADLFVECVRHLLEHGADVSAKTPYGQSALHWACKSGLVDAMRLLWLNGADIDLQDKFEFTPLMAATDSSLNGLIVCKHLIQWGANLSIRDRNDDCTAFHIAVGNGNRELATYFLQQGISPNTGTKKEDREVFRSDYKQNNLHRGPKLVPLHIAVLNDNLLMVKLLVRAFVDVNCFGDSGKEIGQVPLDSARIINILALAGVTLRGIDIENVPDDISVIVKEVRDTVAPLKHLTRLTIRGAVRKRYREIDKLPLPKVLLRYIEMQDVLGDSDDWDEDCAVSPARLGVDFSIPSTSAN